MIHSVVFAATLPSVCSQVFFFFQAEDGIRDYKVTGVQTCALPITLGAGTYQLTIPGTSAGAAAGDLNISGDLTIAGTDVSSTLVSGALLGDRVLNVAASRVVTVQGLTIRDATSGGVLNSGDLTMANVSVTMNTTDPLTRGGGIDNAG